MASDPGLWLVLLINAAILVGGTTFAMFLFRRQKRNREDGEGGAAEWYEGVRSLAREVAHTAESFDHPADPDRVSRSLLPLAYRIQGHVRAAPAAVDGEIYRQLFELGVTCQRLGVEHRPARIAFEDDRLGDRLRALGDEASALETRVAASS